MEAPHAPAGWARCPATPRGMACALCHGTAPRVQHWQPAADSLVSYPWDKNVIGSFSASRRRRGKKKKDTCLPCPQLAQVKSSGERRRCWGTSRGLQVLCTRFTVSTLPPLGTRLICLAQEGTDGEGRAQWRGGERGRQDQTCLLGRAPLPPSPQAGLFGELSTHQDA